VVEVSGLKVEVLGFEGLKKEIDEDGTVFYTAPADAREFAILVRLNGRKRKIRFYRQKWTAANGDAVFVSARVHRKFASELEQLLAEEEFYIDEVFKTWDYCNFIVCASVEGDKLYM